MAGILEGDLRTWLLQQPAIEALVKERVYSVRLQQASVMPCIVISLVSTNPVMSSRGYSGLRFRRIQIDVYSKERDEVIALGEAIFRALAGFTGHMVQTEVQHALLKSERDIDEPDVDLYRRSQDWEFAEGG